MKKKFWNKYTRSGLLVLVGLLIFVVAYKINQTSTAQQVQTQRVIVAKQNIPPYTALKKEMLEYKNIVMSAVPSDAITDANQINFDDAFSSSFGILQGAPLQKQQITKAAESQMGTAVSLKAGYTQIGVKTDLAMSAGDGAKPGVLVDVIAYVGNDGAGSTKVVDPSLKGLRVLKRLNSEGTVPDPNVGNSLIPSVVVLEVTPQQAAAIMEYQESGKVYLLPVGVSSNE